MARRKTLSMRVFAGGLVLAMMLSLTPVNTFASEVTVLSGVNEQSETTEALMDLQEQINALPTGDEYRKMSADEQDAVYELAASVSDAYFELSEEDQTKVDIARLEELFAVMNEEIALLTAGNVNYESIEINPSSLNGNAIRGVHEDQYTAAMDNYGHFYSETHASTGGLPNNGKLTMSSGVSYVLAAGESGSAYDGNDCIRLTSSTLSQTMDLETLGVYQNIYVLATAGGPGTGHYADFKVTLTYTDGTSAETTYQLYDWYDLRDISNVEKYYNIMRMNNGSSSTNGSVTNSDGPVLHSATITVDSTKLLKQITFTMNGKNGNASEMSGLYCCIFAVTGATPAGVPTAPVAIAATKNEGDTSGAFNANWNAVADATSYRLDVATDRKFTSILSDYNNKDVSNVTSVEVSGNSINADTTYYYRVRAVNDKGQSLSSNRVSTDLPIWLKNALADTDYANVEYDAEQNKITFKQDVELKDTIMLPTEDATTIELGGNQITASEGQPAISAGSGTNVEIIISDNGGDGGIVGNGTDENGNGAPVIDFSSATGNSKIELEQTTVIGSDGADGSSEGGSGGSGGAGIAAGSGTQITVGTGSNVIGGKGGDSTEGDGGNGGAGITGGSVAVDEGGSVTGGDGGNSPVKPGEGGSAGSTGGKDGEDGKQHAHSWVYTANGNQITAYCAQTSGAQYCYHQSRENAITLTLNASDIIYSGDAYDGAKAVTAEWNAAYLHVPKIRYVGTGSMSYEESDAAPVNAGTYEASITAGDQTATAAFTIRPKSIAATDVITQIDQTSFEHTGNEITPNITVKDNTRNAALVAGTDYELSGDTSKTDVCTGEAYKIVITGKGNYSGTVEKTWMIVDSASSGSVIVAPTARAITYGQLLSESVLEGGSVTINGNSVAGTFAWADGSVKPSVSDSDTTEYSVIFTPTSSEYGLLTCAVKVQVNPKSVQLLWNPVSFTYNGTTQCPTAKVTNAEDGDVVTVSVSGGQTNANTAETPQYTATAVLGGADADNYALPENAQKNYKIYPKQITDGMASVIQTFFTSEVSDISSYITVKDGNATLTKATHYDLTGSVSASAIGTYTVEVGGKGNYTGTVNVTYKITDSTPPTGKIKIADDEWTELQGSIAINRFYTEKQTVTITAEDASGVKTIGYFITSSNASQSEEDLRALPDSKWTEITNGGTFTLNPDNKYVIYAKITDNSGNIAFLSTNGIVLDANAPMISGIEDGKTYCNDVTFTVSDKIGIASVKIDGAEKGTGGSYSIQAGAEIEDHTIIAKDQTENVISYTITVNANGAHSFSDDSWTIATAPTCETDGLESRSCSACGAVETRTIPALGHSYQAESNDDAHFVWTATKDANGVVTGYTARVSFICKNDAQHVDIKDCGITETEDANGVKTYTAWVVYNERYFSAQKCVEVQNPTKLESTSSSDDSNIYTATNVLEGAPVTSVAGLDTATVKNLMTEEEKDNYNNADVSTDVTLYLEVQNITGTVNGGEEAKVEAELKDLVTEKENNTADLETKTGAAYLDLSMYKNVKVKETVGDEPVITKDETTQVTDTGKVIKITVDIPQAIRVAESGYTRNYYIIRVHDGVTERITPRHIGNQLSFETDRFSTYAIAYVDVKDTSVTPPSEYGGGTVITPQPDDPKKEEQEEDTEEQEKEDSENGSSTAVTVDTTYRKLRLAEAKATRNTVKLSWKQDSDADGYVIYGALCNSKGEVYRLKAIADIRDGSKTAYTNKNLESGTYYKYRIKAYKLVNGKKVWLAKSKVIHVTTTGGKYGNAKSVKVNKTGVTLTEGKTFAIEASQVAGSKPIRKHTEIKYESANSKVASVNSKGVIKAKSKGTCYIYVYAQNGMYKRIKVTVK